MSVPEQVPYKEYRATGSNNSFEITFYLPDPKDLVVMVNKEIPLVGAYSIQGNTVVFSTPPNEGDLVELTRDTQMDRETNFKSYDNSFRPETINFDLDKIWLVLQESNLVDAKILARLKQEIEWRRTHDFNYDELAQVREKQLFDALKGYTDTLLASTNPGVFQGVIAGVVFARDGKSIQTHIEEILDVLAANRIDIDSKAPQEYVDEQLNQKANSVDVYQKTETYSQAAVNNLLLSKAEQSYVDNSLSNLMTEANKFYPTLVAANADISNISTSIPVTIGESGANGGLWYKASSGATTLTKSPYDPLQQAKDFANANGLFKPVIVQSNSTTPAGEYRTSGWYVFVSSAPAIAAGLPTPTAGFLLVINSGNMVHQKWIPFNSNIEYTRTSNVSAVFPDFKKLLIQSDLDASLESYINDENITRYLTKPYEITSVSKNLYDANKKQLGVIVGNNGAIQAAAGWSCSDFIPVIPGEYYTISFSTKRQNLAFYAQKGTVGMTAIEYNTSAGNPLTVQVPAGAAYLVVNIDSATVSAANVQVEKGQSATSYEEGGIQYKIDPSYISDQSVALNNLRITGNNATVAGAVDGVPISLDLLLTKVNEAGDPTVLNFAGDYVNGIQHRNLNDDVAPMRLDGTTIGANHGYQKSNVTLAAHGKTVADIGSVWTSGGKQYVIIGIISNDVLSITSRADNSAFVLAELTHVSGATNTVNFTPTATVSAQWFPSIKNRVLNCFVDDKKIDLSVNGAYSFKNTVKFLESYSIMKKSDIVEWLITNKGQNHVNYNAVPAYTVNFGYTFDHECGCTIYFGGVGRKTVDLVDQMITQSIQLAQGNGVVYNYIPKAIAFTAGGFTYNFSQLENLYSKNPSTPLYLTTARQETETSPIDRIVMLNDQVGYATGYLPVLDAAPDVRVTNASRKYLEIRNGSLKLYPRLIDSDSITQINEGDAFAAIAYRKYFKRSADRTCNYVVRSELGDYLYLDWHSAKTDEIELPSDLIGREFEIVEKSSNVTLLSKFASNSILVKINSTKPYGYLVLKFK